MSRPTRLVAGTSGTATTTAARALRPPAEPRPDSSAPPTELVWAREFTLLALCLPGLPRIVVGALLDQPGKRIAQNTLTLIDLLLAQGFTIEHFIGDMAYLPGCKMEELALPLRARGIKGV